MPSATSPVISTPMLGPVKISPPQCALPACTASWLAAEVSTTSTQALATPAAKRRIAWAQRPWPRADIRVMATQAQSPPIRRCLARRGEAA